MVDDKHWGKSFMYNRKSIGPSEDPWGDTDINVKPGRLVPIAVYNLCSVAQVGFKPTQFNPIYTIFTQFIQQDGKVMVSKHFCKSRKIATVGEPASIFSNQSSTIQ